MEHIKNITKDLTPRYYNKGEKIFSTGEIAMGAAMVVSGMVEISTNSNRLALLHQGDLFGEVALATSETRTADARALENTKIIFFMKQDLEDLQKVKPSIAAKCAINLANVLATRLRYINLQPSEESHSLAPSSLAQSKDA